ncbi:MAG: metallophosphoesterase family protein [Verrucomicrobia bacterium]|nr:metallophosphoesterase family protein [Verrucomicrobiota bacterium]MCH8527003.1 metallophosphoesterase [Kiritimatiellia bacterium]
MHPPSRPARPTPNKTPAAAGLLLTPLGPVLTLCLCLFSASAVYAQAHFQELKPSPQPIHVRVQFKNNPANEAVVSWTTTRATSENKLYLSTDPKRGRLEEYPVHFASQHTFPFTLRDEEKKAGMHAWSHNVFLNDLKPATFYYLTVVSDGAASEEFHFKTAPDDERDIRILMVGDSRTPRRGRIDRENERRQVNALMAGLLETHPDIVAMLHGGDYTNHARWGEFYWWLKDHSETSTTSENRLLPVIPARGNHDVNPELLEYFWWPDRVRDFYYTSNLSGTTTLLVLNTEISRGGDQRQWLEEQLAKLRPLKRWLLVMQHQPNYPSARSYEAMAPIREAWVPLFERYGVDAVYESHDHTLKRTHPVYQGQINQERGLIYFGDGGGGVPQRRAGRDRWYLAVNERYHHVHLAKITGEEIHIQAISLDGQIVDDFKITLDRRALYLREQKELDSNQ